MKAVRILEFIVLLLVAGYLFLLHNINPQTVRLPFILPLPTAVVIAVALFLGWLAGWLPARMRIWRLKRDNRRLEARLVELEPAPAYYPGEPSTPVIPDRDPSLTRGDKRRSETENF